MHFKSLSTLILLAFSACISAAPISLQERDVVHQLDRRAVTINFSNDPTGDFKPIPPVAPLPASPPPTKKQQAIFDKKTQAFKDKTDDRATLLDEIHGKIQTVLDAAQAPLGLPANLDVAIKSTFHNSDDPILHATFKFKTATGNCAVGVGCVGHAYRAPAPGTLPGKIFADLPDKDARQVFGDSA